MRGLSVHSHQKSNARVHHDTLREARRAKRIQRLHREDGDGKDTWVLGVRGFYWRHSGETRWTRGFHGDPVVADLVGKFRFRTRVDILFITRKGAQIEVPAGTETDFRSSPFSNRIGPDGFATIIHDYLCVLGVSRIWANNVYYDAMDFLGVDASLRVVRWVATTLWYYPFQAIFNSFSLQKSRNALADTQRIEVI